MLIPVGVLLIVACVTLMLGSPRLLKLESWQIRRPGRALVLWHAALVLGAMAGACGLGALVVGGAVARRDPSAAAPEAIRVIVAWTLLLGVGGLLAFLLTTVEGLSTSLHDARGDLSAERVRVVDDSLVSLVSFASEEMMAVAVPGGRPTVYISLGLRHELPDRQLVAVVAHEVAHISRRHHWMLRLAQLNALLLPGTRAGRDLKQATLILIELDADDVAARIAGEEELTNALNHLAACTADASMELRSRRLAGDRPRGRPRRQETDRRRLEQLLRSL